MVTDSLLLPLVRAIRMMHQALLVPVKHLFAKWYAYPPLEQLSLTRE
ncbi:MAG: hypothetical protein NWQ26_04560 [Paraglaciecola sp.]|nr:hypothetical protein [Paraglaciecola sp.]